jgi:hypothetical protein
MRDVHCFESLKGSVRFGEKIPFPFNFERTVKRHSGCLTGCNILKGIEFHVSFEVLTSGDFL